MGPQLPTREGLLTHLGTAQQVLEEMGEDGSGYKARIGELRDRLMEGRFRLAVLGQFKRGKSSLLNALLGEPLLPVGVLPLTAIPTVLRHGPEQCIRVSLLDGRCDTCVGPVEVLAPVLMRYVSERANQGNHLGVTRVEVEHPSPLLAQGVEIIDTPGIGSTILHNTKMARAVLPVCDGALFILSPDPPITEGEVQFLRAVKDMTARVIVVVTKADRLSPRERQELLGFLQQVLHEQAGFSQWERLFLVSAHQALEARATDDGALWARSGMGELEAFLRDFLLTDKQAALIEALRAKAARVIGEVLFALDLQHKAIELPRQELERRNERFEAQLAKIGLERTYVRDRLAGDRERVIQQLDQQAETLAVQAREALAIRAQKAVEEAGQIVGFKQRERRVRAALSNEVERVFGQAAGRLQAATVEYLKSVQDIHCRTAEILIEQVRRTVADLFEVPYLEPPRLDRLEAIREPQVVCQRWITSFSEQAVSCMTMLLPSGWRARLLEQRLQQDIDYLVARNIGELRWVLRQDLEHAFRVFRERLEAQLDDVIGSICVSIRTALEQQAHRQASRAPELKRLEVSRQKLAQLLPALSAQEGGASHGSPV
jgi:GTPase Era involved in 16S rRNA processing